LGLGDHTHQVRLCIPSGQGCRPSLGTPTTIARGSEALPNLMLLIGERQGPILGSFLAFGTSQHPCTRRCAPSYRGSGAPRRCPAGVALSTTPPTRSHMRRDARRQNPSLASGAQGLLGPPVRPLSRHPLPPKILQKVHLVDTCPSRHNLTLSVSEQSSQTVTPGPI
jgi:hypothetical protein